MNAPLWSSSPAAPVSPPLPAALSAATSANSTRLDYLDAVRAFALVLGVVFHASLSFTPWFMGWAVQDISTSPLVGHFILVSHAFRMELFFLIAGFFAHRNLARVGVREFVQSRAVRLLVPFLVGWFLLRPLLVSVWTMGAASLRGDYAFWASLGSGFQELRNLPAGIFTGTHLWFLYYLLLVTAAALLGRAAMRLAGARGASATRAADAATGWAARSAWAGPVLVAPVAGALWFMDYWGMDTPDRTLTPHWPVLAVYGAFFGFGWMLDRAPAAMKNFGNLGATRWIGAGVGVAACVALAPIQTDPGHSLYLPARAGFVVAYATMMWSLVALTLGLFQRFCFRPNAVIRYCADSSYWMYLVHLPVVAWLQVAVAEIPLPWSVKLAFVSVATVGLALLSYDLLVRSTWLGGILNGRQRERVIFGTREPAGRGLDAGQAAKGD